MKQELPSATNEKEINSKIVERLSKFDTDGFDEYPKDKFLKYIKENNINTPKVLDSYMENVNPVDKFSDGEMKYIQAFRAWLHSDFQNVKEYINDKFNFKCESNEDFVEKYRFFNTVAVFISDNHSIWKETETIREEKFIFEALREQTAKNNGSFLLNYLAKDYISVIRNKKYSVQDETHFERAPFKISPKQYAFDSSVSFAGIYKNSFKSHELCISNEKDFEKVNEIMDLLGEDFLEIGQDKFEELSQYFSILKPQDLIVNFKSKSSDEIEMYLFKELNSKYHRTNLIEKTGIDFSQLSLIEQKYFINYLKFVDSTSLEKVRNFNKKFNENGFRTFLSIEQGGKEMGDKILFLGEKLPKEIAEKIFKKYGEIIDNVSKITEFTRTNFTKDIETNPELIRKIEETLYIKGKQLLSQTYDDISNKKGIDYEDIGKQLDRINADTITTFAIFKQAVRNGAKLPIESIEGSVFSKKEANSITDDQQNEMLELYESNWKNYPDRNFVESLKSYFKTAFAPEDNKRKNFFYTFEKDDNIRAFVRFEQKENRSLYASALNVDEASKNFGLGEAMMDEALTREAKEHILHASCRKDNPSNMRYFEKGFISRGFKKTNETEEFDLVWDESKNKDIVSKQKSPEELIGLYGNNSIQGFEIKKSKDLESLHTDLPQGKSLVRCFINNGEWYAVYETIKEDYGMNLGEIK